MSTYFTGHHADNLESDSATYERHQDELAHDLCGARLYHDGHRWRYRGLARVQRCHVGLTGRGSVTADLAYRTLVKALRLYVDRYAMAVVTTAAQRARSGKVKAEVYRATRGQATEMFPTRRRVTVDERHQRQLKLWGWV